jgi:ABC-type multidrug transport system fused ATPase/permease subunit
MPSLLLNPVMHPATLLRTKWNDSSIGRSFNLLETVDKRRVLAVTFIQIVLGALDLLGVFAIGLLGALSVSGVQSNNPGEGVNAVLELLQISELTFQVQASIIAIAAVFSLLVRTLLSIFLTRKVLFFLSRRGAEISANLIARLLAQPLLVIQSRSTQETLYSVTKGVELIVLHVLATSVVIAADFSLLLMMAVVLFIVDPATAVGVFIVFTIIGIFLYIFMHLRAYNLGLKNSNLNVASNEKIVEVFSSFRETVVRNRGSFYAGEIRKLRFELSDISAEMNFLPYVSKYVIEMSVILGAVLVGLIQFILQDATHAVATLAVFLAAGSRIAPAVLRLQQGTILIRGSLGQAGQTLDLIESLSSTRLIVEVDNSVSSVHPGFVSEVQIKNVCFTYPSGAGPVVSNVSIDIPAGTSVAFVGPSGAGKTSLVDILLGVIDPDKGSILISGLPPMEAISKWPGAISYVPQDVMVASGTIRDNISLGYPPEVISEEIVKNALKIACLEEFVSTLENGVDTNVGERGTKISGGQRQRLGIARAMITNPRLLVLDEATSSLDGETEANISEAIHKLRGSTTVVIIAHRLSTVKNADKIVYMKAGKVLSYGTFEEVRKSVPEFNHQADLVGL